MKTINTYINEKLRLTTKVQYTCHPKNKRELQNIIKARIKDEGNECDLNDIDVSKITDMSYLFDTVNIKIFENFNGDISMWDVSNVTSMYCMFWGCEHFNCDISKWNVSNVIDMYGTFNNCKEFNCDLSMWDVSNANDMSCMFSGCEKFDCDLSKWTVSKVDDMTWAFKNCPTTPTWYDKDKWE